MSTPLKIIFAIVLFILMVWVFYNTIITKKWKNKYPNERTSRKFLFIYYNPEDPRIIVPKRLGLGLTLNFARPISKIFILLVLILVILHLLSVI